jgi:hypothetical protein
MITVPSLATDGGLGNQGLLKPVGGPGETHCWSTYGQLRYGAACGATLLVVENFYGVDRPRPIEAVYSARRRSPDTTKSTGSISNSPAGSGTLKTSTTKSVV